jgi:hypothetical protein
VLTATDVLVGRFQVHLLSERGLRKKFSGATGNHSQRSTVLIGLLERVARGQRRPDRRGRS